MNRQRQEIVALTILVVGGAVVSCLGINWGLPTRAIDPYLFGRHPIWSGAEIQALAGDPSKDSSRAADMDADPIGGADQVVPVNQTDAQRAEIIRRYRLFTHHPDEMVTLMALASMRPGQRDFDPKMYQYGGLWVYPVGALLRLAGACRVITLTSDLTYYLDHPEAFGRFYIVTRAYVVAWGLVGIWAVFRITHRLTRGSLGASVTAAACFAVMPAVVNAAHEAKPHLPGTVLMLLSVLAGMRCLDNDRRNWWIVSCLLGGAAVGMVLSAWPVFAALVMMALLAPQPKATRLVKAGISLIIALLVYFATNPYVLVNLFRNRELISSNLANTRAMFHFGPPVESVLNALYLIGEGTSAILALAGLAGLIALAVRDWRVVKKSPPVGPRFVAHWLLAAPAFFTLVQFVIFAHGQGGEYARFALFVDVTLCLAAVVALDAFTRYWKLRTVCQMVLLLVTAVPGAAYVESFLRDTTSHHTRLRQAEQLAELQRSGARTLVVDREPAPYCLPPVNLFEWTVIRGPRGRYDGPGQDADVRISVLDAPPSSGAPPLDHTLFSTDGRPWLGLARMSWANKPFAGQARRVFSTDNREPPANAP
ncbi:MAG: glycosyltransferase family 39 protein [Phycisphaerae bacterium]|nr:glycosyltransferase family 39 protein [Phycisphaerae bacterium]